MATSVLLAGKIQCPDGEWLVGDGLSGWHPGRIEPDDPRRLLFKVWTAGGDSSKYIRTPEYKGWEPPLPAHDGRMEGVQVFAGKFGCEKANGAYHTLVPGDSVEVAPDDFRRWYLPRGSDSAFGITICRQVLGQPEGFGAGAGYEYYSFIRPLVFPEWYKDYVPIRSLIKRKLVVVFEGRIRTDDLDAGMLYELEYMFMEKNERVQWRVGKPHTSFAILYF